VALHMALRSCGARISIEVFTTSQGWTLIILGLAIGFVLAVAVLSISVVSFPLLLDRDVGVGPAVISSMCADPATRSSMRTTGCCGSEEPTNPVTSAIS
jgi:uncharacterized membrane protein